MTPGIPDKLECTPEARSVTLSWNVPRLNGNAAKYYEILIKDTENQMRKAKNVSVQQRRFISETLSYEATVNNLSPITTYQFGVQAVNNTTCVGKIAEIEAKTTSAPPDKPFKPIAIEPIMGDPLHAKLELKMLSREQMNGSSVHSVIIECKYNKETITSEVPLEAEQQVENTNTELMIELPSLRDPKIEDYSFYIRMENGVGKSLPSDAFKLLLQPGSPKSMQISDITCSSHVKSSMGRT